MLIITPQAIDLIDEAGSRVRLRHAQLPEEARDLDKELRALLKEKDAAVRGQVCPEDTAQSAVMLAAIPVAFPCSIALVLVIPGVGQHLCSIHAQWLVLSSSFELLT